MVSTRTYESITMQPRGMLTRHLDDVHLGICLRVSDGLLPWLDREAGYCDLGRGAVAVHGVLRGVPAEKGAPETLGAPAREETSSLLTAFPDNSVVSFVVDTWDERLNKAAAIERTIRRQHFLRGYEMGRGGERLGPEEAVAFLEEHAEAAEADIKEASREEIYEIRQMISQCTRPESFDGEHEGHRPEDGAGGAAQLAKCPG